MKKIALSLAVFALAIQTFAAAPPDTYDNIGGYKIRIEQFRHTQAYDEIADEAMEYVHLENWPEDVRNLVLDPVSKRQTWYNIARMMSSPDEILLIAPFITYDIIAYFPNELSRKLQNAYINWGHNGKAPWYNLITLITTENPETVPADHPIAGRVRDYVPRLLNFFEDWLEYYFHETGVAPQGSERAQALKRVAPMNDGRSAFVVVTKWNDLHGLLSMLRVSWRGSSSETSLLSVEKHLGIEIKAPEARVVVENGQEILEAEDAELKNFIHVKLKDPLDFVPIMFDQAFKLKLFDGPGLRKNHQGKEYAWRPARYVMYCDEQMAVKYYEGLGFTPIQAFPEKKIVVMAISRENLFRIPEIFSKRKGQRLLDVSIGTRLGPVETSAPTASLDETWKRGRRWRSYPIKPFNPAEYKDLSARAYFFKSWIHIDDIEYYRRMAHFGKCEEALLPQEPDPILEMEKGLYGG